MDGPRLVRTPRLSIAVWLDHHEARVFHVDLEGFDEKTLLAPAHHFHRESREASLDDAHFFETIAAALGSADEILVYGPSTAKRQFAHWVDAHAPALAKKITHVAEVRRHFRIPAPRVR